MNRHKPIFMLQKFLLILAVSSQIPIFLIFPIKRVNASSAKSIRVLVWEGAKLRIRADNHKPLFVKGIDRGVKKIRSLDAIPKNGNIQINIFGTSNKKVYLSKSSIVNISSRDPRGIWIENRRYRGRLSVYMVNNRLKVINHIRLNKYLASVVGSEMPKSWPIEALRAQAIASRTYVLSRLGKKDKIYDIKSTQASQVYLGIESETKSTNKAVSSTNSLALFSKGKLINAVFHSCSGGRTESSGLVWKKQLPYLISVVDFDQHSPMHQWDVSFTKEQLINTFPETKGVNSLEIIELSPTGRVLQARINGNNGSIILSGSQIRERLNLKSTLFRTKMTSEKPQINKIFVQSFLSNYGINISGESPSNIMRRSFGFWRDWSQGGEVVNDPRLPEFVNPPVLTMPSKNNGLLTNSDQMQKLPPLPSQSINLVMLVRGYGAGHGVGMSQWGANGLAIRGKSFRSILSHYYSGAVIRKFY